MQAPNDQPLEEVAYAISGGPANFSTRLWRGREILKHYNKAQILRRLVNLVRGRLRSSDRVGLFESVDVEFVPCESLVALSQIVFRYRSDHPSHNECDLEDGLFKLLELKQPLFPAGRFDAELFQQQTHLWRFQFHYHEFLLNQITRGQQDRVSDFLLWWLDEFEPSSVLRRGDAWHPYCISRRVIAWIHLLARSAGSDLKDGVKEPLLQSLAHQCDYLKSNLERDLGGNHLLENATALAIASLSLKTPQSSAWKSTAMAILEAELPKQVLASGEHFELSPMYHCHILGNLMRIRAAATGVDAAWGDFLKPIIDSMLEFLKAILHPDGKIPLFADSGFYESPSAAEILDYANDQRPEATLDSHITRGGYEIFRHRNLFVVCDFGPIAAAELPAHGHCDATTLEPVSYTHLTLPTTPYV